MTMLRALRFAVLPLFAATLLIAFFAAALLAAVSQTRIEPQGKQPRFAAVSRG